MTGSFEGSMHGDFKISTKKIALLVTQWNEDITKILFEGAKTRLLALGIKDKNIFRITVPGSFELPLVALLMASRKKIDAVICLGCVIKGETPHFDYICQATAHGIMAVNLKSKKPVIFGILTTINKKQAMDRAGGKLGNKGEEAAMTAVKMLEVVDKKYKDF